MVTRGRFIGASGGCYIGGCVSLWSCVNVSVEMNQERCLTAAEGYLQLEMPVEAVLEIERLPVSVRQGVHSSELELAAQMMQKHWNRGAELARLLCKMKPSKRAYFLHAAYCLHETGDTLAAKSFLMSGPKSLIKDALFHYNMACYSAVLGDKSEASRCLTSALELDPKLRETALSDEDLKGIKF